MQSQPPTHLSSTEDPPKLPSPSKSTIFPNNFPKFFFLDPDSMIIESLGPTSTKKTVLTSKPITPHRPLTSQRASLVKGQDASTWKLGTSEKPILIESLENTPKDELKASKGRRIQKIYVIEDTPESKKKSSNEEVKKEESILEIIPEVVQGNMDIKIKAEEMEQEIEGPKMMDLQESHTAVPGNGDNSLLLRSGLFVEENVSNEPLISIKQEETGIPEKVHGIFESVEVTIR